jgi:hypothetical protein
MTGKRRRNAASGAVGPEGQDGAVAPVTEADGTSQPGGLADAGYPADGPASAAVSAFAANDAVVRRTKDGWRVGGDDLPDLTCAMILADLLAAENGMPESAGGKPDGQAGSSEAGRLRATVGQLEHALITRIRVEQAIGVLAERHRIKPRQAFEQLRDAARSRGRRVIDIAGDVVASATNPLLQLPDELSRPRPRRGARPSGAQ